MQTLVVLITFAGRCLLKPSILYMEPYISYWHISYTSVHVHVQELQVHNGGTEIQMTRDHLSNLWSVSPHVSRFAICQWRGAEKPHYNRLLNKEVVIEGARWELIRLFWSLIGCLFCYMPLTGTEKRKQKAGSLVLTSSLVKRRKVL